MATVGWGKRLKIDYAAGTMTSNLENIEDKDRASGFPTLTDMCERMLSPDYTYDLS